jgi:hypothetical protein
VLLLILAIVVGLSALTWLSIERPGQRLFGRRPKTKPLEMSVETA